MHNLSKYNRACALKTEKNHEEMGVLRWEGGRSSFTVQMWGAEQRQGEARQWGEGFATPAGGALYPSCTLTQQWPLGPSREQRRREEGAVGDSRSGLLSTSCFLSRMLGPWRFCLHILLPLCPKRKKHSGPRTSLIVSIFVLEVKVGEKRKKEKKNEAVTSVWPGGQGRIRVCYFLLLAHPLSSYNEHIHFL